MGFMAEPVRMKRFSKLVAAGLILAGIMVARPAEAQFGLDALTQIASNIDIEGFETSFDPETGVATATGDVVISYEGVEIRSNRARDNFNTGEVIASGGARVIKDGNIYYGETLSYNLQTGRLSGGDLRSGFEPLYFSTGGFELDTSEMNVLEGEEVLFTTHDFANPNYSVRARRITIYPDDRVVLRNATFYAGNVPVFYLPYFVQPLDDEVGYFFTPGYSSDWGGFLLNQYGILHGNHTLAKYMLDFRTERGVAGGVEFISQRHRGNPNFGRLLVYYAYDLDPTQDSTGFVRQNLDDNRYRINFQHRVYLPGPEESTFYVDFDINRVSDQFFYEDFFYNDARLDRTPDNMINMVKTTPRGTLSLLGRFQVNDFYTTDTRLPELALDFTRQPILSTGVFYQGESSFGIYEELISDIDEEQTRNRVSRLEGSLREERAAQAAIARDPSLRGTRGGLVDIDETELELLRLRRRLIAPEFTRFHTYHELLYPATFGDWLNVVPRVGGGGTFYSSIDEGAASSSDSRAILHAGVDVSFKLTRTWDEVSNRRLGLDGLRHVVQPYVNYSYLNVDDPVEGFRGIDRLVPSTRARQIDVPLFTAIDDLRSWNVFRVGVSNILQTRRDLGTVDWFGINTYVDVFGDDPEYDRDLSNLYVDLFWNPLPWLRFNIDSQFPIGSSDFNFTELNTYVTWQPVRNFEFSIGHLYLGDYPLIPDSSLLAARTFVRFNDNWGFSMTQRYEFEDSVLEYQSYTIHRDLTSWSASFGGFVRDNRNDDEVGLLLQFTLKEFPGVRIPLNIDPAPGGGN